MEYLRQTIESDKLNSLFNLPPALRNTEVEVIILPVEKTASETPKCKRQLGFAKGSPLLDSFFDPLSEKELEAWGL